MDKIFKCHFCDNSYTTTRSQLRHEKNEHAVTTKKKKEFKCLPCNLNVSSKKELLEHMKDNHEEEFNGEETLHFNSMVDFQLWKDDVEKSTAASFVLKNTYKTKKMTVKLYECHRSGEYSGRGKGQRNLKMHGTNKIGSTCPAGIRLEIKAENDMNVEFCSTHAGHVNEIGRLRLLQSDKDKIASQLNAGVPIDSILDEIAENASPNERLSLTHAQDVRNIAASRGINVHSVRSEDNVLSVDMWVNEMVERDYNPILIFKTVGEEVEHFPLLTKEDFVLGFMNEAQKDVFQLYGTDVISVDSTHGTNKYNVQLTSVIVKDQNNWEGFPVAFLWSNRQHEDIFNYFFKACQEKVGELQINTFISDDYPAFYNAWKNAFGPAVHYVLCDWHIKRAWDRNLVSGPNRIKNEDKRLKVQKKMYTLINETDEHTFNTLFHIVKDELLNDPETKAFGQYFESNYASRSHQWSSVNKVNAHIRTNMNVERWHRDLKYNSDLKGKCGGCLDKAINSLMKSLRKKLMGRHVSLHRGKLTKRINKIRNFHKEAVNMLNLVVILKEDGMWTISSATTVGVVYQVKKKTLENHNCNLVCQFCRVCLHQFTCTCANNALHYNMCKHIHALCLSDPSLSEEQHLTQKSLSDSVASNFEKEAIANCSELFQSAESNSNEAAREECLAVIQALQEAVKNNYNAEQCREISKMIGIAQRRCRAIAEAPFAVKELPPVASTHSCAKRIQQQQAFPKCKRQKKERKIPSSNNVAKAALNLDHGSYTASKQ